MVDLKQVENVAQFIDDSGLATLDLYNSSGAMLVPKGHLAHDSIYRIAVYIYQEEDLTRPCNSYINLVPKKEARKISVFSDFISSEDELLYVSIKSRLELIFNSESTSRRTFQNAISIIDDTFKSQRGGLIKALWLLRSSDKYTCDHSLSVYLLFLEALDSFKVFSNDNRFFDSLKNVGSKVNFNDSNLKRYAIGALLHDLGKSHIDDAIVHKLSSLTLGELDIIRLHPYYGMRVLKSIGVEDSEILDIVGNHHYNYKVNDDTQSPLAQICNIVDIYDACRSPRSYKEPFSWEKTLSILNSEFEKSGWDPFIFEVVVTNTLAKNEELLAFLELA